MIWLYYILLILISLAGIAIVTLTLPGLWVMTGAAVIFALITHERGVGVKTLAALFTLSLIGEILEMTTGGAVARKAGGGRRAAVGALIGGIAGGIIGTFFIPIFLSIIGVCVGSLVGAALFELLGGGEAVHSLRVGWGAARGRFYGVVIKVVIGLIMLLLILITAFP